MARIVVVSPTLADAIQSAGGTIASHATAGHDVVVVTVFEQRETDAGRNAAVDALGVSGVVSVGLPPADVRGYTEASGDAHRGRQEDDADTAVAAGAALAVTISALEPELVLAPIGLTGHVDSAIIGEALDRLAVPALRWLDLPYGLSRTPGAPLGAGEVVAVPVGGQLDAKLAACDALGIKDAGRLIEHARAEGARLSAGGPVELLLRPPDLDGA